MADVLVENNKLNENKVNEDNVDEPVIEEIMETKNQDNKIENNIDNMEVRFSDLFSGIKSNEKFDIIDLDFKQFPGTRGSMRPKTKPDRDINPWFAPVYAARDFLKPGGLLMVTYVANSYRKQNMGEPTFLTMIQNPGNKMSQYLNTDQNVDKNFILNLYFFYLIYLFNTHSFIF